MAFIFKQKPIYLVVVCLCVALLLPQRALGLDSHADLRGITCLIQDPHVQNGVTVYDPVEGAGHNPSGILKGFGGVEQPLWGLSQWNSKLPFRGTPEPTEANSAFIKYDSGSKSISFGAAHSIYGDVTLRLDASKEYVSGWRRKGERWPALYLWQRFEASKPISELSGVHFALDAVLHFSNNMHPAGTYNPADNAAQFSIFLTVQNLNKKSPNFGRYVWFGLPVYDNRYAMSHQHQQKDAFTKKFIYEVDSSEFAKNSIHDGHWVHMEADLLPELIKSIQLAIAKGFFQQPVSTGEFSIKSINVGWEMPGTFDAEIQFKDLNLCIN